MKMESRKLKTENGKRKTIIVLNIHAITPQAASSPLLLLCGDPISRNHDCNISVCNHRIVFRPNQRGKCHLQVLYAVG